MVESVPVPAVEQVSGESIPDEIARIGATKPRAPRLTDEERAECLALLADEVGRRLERVAAHRRRLEEQGQQLGRDVAAYRVTLANANARLDILTWELDPEVPAVPLALVQYRIARDVVRQAFLTGLRGGR